MMLYILAFTVIVLSATIIVITLKRTDEINDSIVIPFTGVFGKLVVDNQWEFEVTHLSLDNGCFWFYANASGLPGVEKQTRKCELYGIDGQVCITYEINLGWPEVNGSIAIPQSVNIKISGNGQGTFW